MCQTGIYLIFTICEFYRPIVCDVLPTAFEVGQNGRTKRILKQYT